MRLSQRCALCAALLVAVSCAAMGVAAAQTPPEPASAPEHAPLSKLARYSLGRDGYGAQLVWSPDSLHVALTGVEADDKRWVMVYGALPSSEPLRVQEDINDGNDPTQALWLDPIHLAVIDPSGERVWEVTADGVKAADTAHLNAITPEQVQSALDDQCVRHDPARGLHVIGNRGEHGLRWSHPMQPRDLWLGNIASLYDHLLPCVSPDRHAVAFTIAATTYRGEAQLVLASLSGQAAPSKEPAPALWGPWTHAQLLAAIYPTGAPNASNFTLKALPWPGRADAVAVLTYGFAHRGEGVLNVHVLTQASSKLRMVATASLSLPESHDAEITMSASPIALHDTEGVLFVKQCLESTGAVGTWGSETWSYLRFNGDKLDVILSFNHSDHDNNDRRGREYDSDRSLTVLKPTRDGFHNVSIFGTQTSTDYRVEGDEPAPVTSKIKETWRWDGAQYQLVK
jgi:hypothetical protein